MLFCWLCALLLCCVCAMRNGPIKSEGGRSGSLEADGAGRPLPGIKKGPALFLFHDLRPGGAMV